MVKHSVNKLPKNTVELLVEIPWEIILKQYDKAFDVLAKDLQVEGFRKGKAPKSVAQKHIPKDRVYDAAIRAYLPEVYEELVKKEGIKPIAQPKIDLIEAKENETWKVSFKIPLAPAVKIKGYREIVTKAKQEAKKTEIWVPGKDEKDVQPDPNKQKEAVLQAVLNALVEKIDVEISDVIVQEEVNARLIKLVEDLQKLGISLDQYVQSRNTTIEKLREQLTKETTETYKLEFILQAIGDEEKVAVEKEDIEKMMGALQNEKERQAFLRNGYYYASLLRKQKILELLVNL
ncbi:MAG: trigger factor [Patescibacteria group bacterium]|nr:trigger factor [Patescibacteria group bacterium]